MELNPLFEFNKDSFFLIDLRIKNYESLKSSIKDLKSIIPNNEEIAILTNYINELEQKNNLNIIHNEITILPEYYNSLQKICSRYMQVKFKI